LNRQHKQGSEPPTQKAGSLGPQLQQIDRTWVIYKGKRLSYFAGCDYFRLSSHPEVLKALTEGLSRYGLNVAASRKTTGNHPIYQELERRLAEFFAAPTATLVSSGYISNLTVAQAHAGHFTHVLLDSRSHCALKESALYLSGKVVEFRHADPASLAAALKRLGPTSKPVLLTDGMFAHDGALAPLPDYRALLPPTAALWVDDAHGAGTLGEHGRGTVEVCGLSRNGLVQTLTLSKAFGVYGGVILGDAATREAILARSSIFAGHTPVPLPLACAALQAIDLLQKDPTLRSRLVANTTYVKSTLRQAGRELPQNDSPIVRVVPGSALAAQALRRRLLKHGVFPSLIQYPGNTTGPYFRFAWSSEHTRAQLDALLQALVNS
jgi:7-keto-8-aminopelargonate synthetase-like enzyme